MKYAAGKNRITVKAEDSIQKSTLTKVPFTRVKQTDLSASPAK